MTNEKMNEALVAEAEYSEEMLDALRASIAELEEKEVILTEKLAKAREAGLMYQSARCRALLQKVVMMKQSKKDELKVAEAQILADELDALANEMENELDPEFVARDEAAVADIATYRMKAKKNRVISKVLSFVALFACITGAIAYLVLSLPEVMNLPFNWVYLAADAAVLVVLLLISASLSSAAKANAQIADELEAERQKAIDEYNERIRIEMMSLASLEAVAEAYEIEGIGAPAIEEEIEEIEEEAGEKAEGKYAALIAKIRAKIPAEKLEKVDKVAAKVKKSAKVVVPVASVCLAALAINKYNEGKRRAQNREKFYQWLG